MAKVWRTATTAGLCATVVWSQSPGLQLKGLTITNTLLGPGSAFLDLQQLLETLPVPAALLGPGEHYALEVAGDSMVEEGILDGDYALIRRTWQVDFTVRLLLDTPVLRELAAEVQRLHAASTIGTYAS